MEHGDGGQVLCDISLGHKCADSVQWLHSLCFSSLSNSVTIMDCQSRGGFGSIDVGFCPPVEWDGCLLAGRIVSLEIMCHQINKTWL